MVTARCRADLVCERGENLVKIRFLEVLGWVPRKDHPDDGIDLNVEIPAEGERPSERTPEGHSAWTPGPIIREKSWDFQWSG